MSDWQRSESPLLEKRKILNFLKKISVCSSSGTLRINMNNNEVRMWPTVLPRDDLHTVPGTKELEWISERTSAPEHNVVNFSHSRFDSQLL